MAMTPVQLAKGDAVAGVLCPAYTRHPPIFDANGSACLSVRRKAGLARRYASSRERSCAPTLTPAHRTSCEHT
jgi:hypothetical protein